MWPFPAVDGSTTFGGIGNGHNLDTYLSVTNACSAAMSTGVFCLGFSYCPHGQYDQRRQPLWIDMTF